MNDLVRKNIIQFLECIRKDPDRFCVQLQPEVLEILNREEFLNDYIFIGISGGADSLYLSLLIIGLYYERKDRIILLHYNHCLRDKDSDEDAVFVKSVGEILGVHCIIERAAKYNRGYEKEQVNEEHLRELRHRFFKKWMEVYGAEILLTGHHSGDVAETVLMRLTRGSGLDGLCAPKSITPIHLDNKKIYFLKPLLKCDKEDIIKTLGEYGIEWREDKSNEGLDYYRNRIRNVVIPCMESVLPKESHYNIFKTIGYTRQLLSDDNEYIEGEVNNVWEKIRGEYLDFKKVGGRISIGILRRVFYKWVQSHPTLKDIVIERSLVEKMLESIVKDNTFDFSVHKEIRLIFKDKRLSVIINKSVCEWPVAQEIYYFISQKDEMRVYSGRGEELRVEILWLGEEERERMDKNFKEKDLSVVYLDYEKLRGGEDIEGEGVRGKWLRIGIRRGVVGDKNIPLGSRGYQGLKDQYVNRKIKNLHWSEIPIIFISNDKDFIWAPFLLPPERYKINNLTRYVVKIHYQLY